MIALVGVVAHLVVYLQEEDVDGTEERLLKHSRLYHFEYREWCFSSSLQVTHKQPSIRPSKPPASSVRQRWVGLVLLLCFLETPARL